MEIYFFPPSSQSNYNYNVNIKYEYDLKNEEDSNDSPPGQPPCSTPSDYQNHASQPVETNFSSASFVPSYSGLEIRSPKIEKDCFFNGYTNGDCEVEEENACLPKNCSPVANGHGSMDGEEDDDGEELNTKVQKPFVYLVRVLFAGSHLGFGDLSVRVCRSLEEETFLLKTKYFFQKMWPKFKRKKADDTRISSISSRI
ncbi:hypothetical protein ANCCAN_29733 [Ancylostoma caninum]|uniref:Uncharacterized protein n=1 Tax=Ancylostoma caninum TaxID=29170 RepID=A0A368F0J2_ANCCA|nr:hypothetical protein ANCCAN_29733 [Ancylostoma caninum]